MTGRVASPDRRAFDAIEPLGVAAARSNAGASGTGSAADPAAEHVDPLGERLLAAAAEVFAERGYERAGVAEIARRAGVTTGAIYGRYRGKAELLVEAIDPHASDELEALFAAHNFEGRMADILRVAGAGLVDTAPDAATHTSLLLEVFLAARRHVEVGEVLRARVLERQARLTEIIERAKAEGDVDDDLDTTAVVAFCHALAFGFLLFDATNLPMPESEPWGRLIERLVASLSISEPSRTA